MVSQYSLGKDHVFEVRDKDVLGRVGRLHTKSGVIETPCLLPVIHPANQIVTGKEMQDMGFQAIMTNAYLTRRAFGFDIDRGIHELLDFDGVIATDSGAYQILTYGEIEADQAEIITFEERIRSDIAVILDIPTGLTTNRRHAERTVSETIKRADQALMTIKEKDILWVGPVQGGTHFDMVAQCAREMNSRSFPILALGSPTQVMEQYMYRELVQMILTCRENISPSIPLHLFGGGHPSMLALAVSLGCDLFDSASYAIFARNNRYMTTNGTVRLDDLEYLPCSCSICRKSDVRDLKTSPPSEKTRKLSIHNLNVLIEEIRRIKQSTIEGRLWELVMQRVRAHPKLYEAVHVLSSYRALFEKHSPMTKKRGVFFFDRLDLSRPEIVRFRTRVTNEYLPPEGSKTIVLLPTPTTRPYYADNAVKKVLKSADEQALHICFFKIPYGIFPMELGDVFPVAQTEASKQLDSNVLRDTAEAVVQYLGRFRNSQIILHISDEDLSRTILSKVKGLCKKTNQKLRISYGGGDAWRDEAVESLCTALREVEKSRKQTAPRLRK